MEVLTHPAQWIFFSTFWFISGMLIIGLSLLLFDALEHGMYIGIPALLLCLVLGLSPQDSPIFQSQLRILAAYGGMVVCFYLACYGYFKKNRAKAWDPNHTED